MRQLVSEKGGNITAIYFVRMVRIVIVNVAKPKAGLLKAFAADFHV